MYAVSFSLRLPFLEETSTYCKLLELMPAPARAKWTESWTLDLTRAESIRYSSRNVVIEGAGKVHEVCPAYLPITDDDEAVFEQMVSIWTGRFTGKLKQVALGFSRIA